MGLFGPSKKDHFTIIVGCGRLGAMLACHLSDAGGEVTVIDSNADALSRLPSSFGGLTLVADGSDLSALEDAGIANAYAIVIVTSDDITNIMIAQLAHEVYQVEHVITRVYDPDREAIYAKLGIETICPVRHSSMKIERIILDDERKG